MRIGTVGTGFITNYILDNIEKTDGISCHAVYSRNEDSARRLAEKYHMDLNYMVGFLDGINESLKGYENPIDTMEEDTEVKIEIDPEKLYYNMVEAKATWLYELPQWKEIFSEEELKKFYKEQKESTTIRKPKKIGRNDPCPCGSGKKYKKCCGR